MADDFSYDTDHDNDNDDNRVNEEHEYGISWKYLTLLFLHRLQRNTSELFAIDKQGPDEEGRYIEQSSCTVLQVVSR